MSFVGTAMCQQFRTVQLEVTREIHERCMAKLDVVAFAYQMRDRNVTVEQALQVLNRDWKVHWSHLDHATFVDMTRIIRDGWRKDNHGKWVNVPKNIDMHLQEEYFYCVVNGY